MISYIIISVYTGVCIYVPDVVLFTPRPNLLHLFM